MCKVLKKLTIHWSFEGKNNHTASWSKINIAKCVLKEITELVKAFRWPEQLKQFRYWTVQLFVGWLICF